ncbi:MAG: hypothetical protein RL685_2898 [Pseudomonadota bacterium]|jgi:CheY-like chemotaxis protein
MVANDEIFGGPLSASSPPLSTALAQLRVLVVDDDDDMRDLVSAILVREGAFVATADSASAGFEALVSGHPQLLVSDIGMPNEDGYSLIRRVRALAVEEGGDIPAIALTAFQTPEDRKQALRAGFNLHLGKPMRPEALVHAVAKLAAAQRS